MYRTSKKRETTFLSTPSARRATEHKREYMDQNKISIHALREEGDVAQKLTERMEKISIHALREEGDPAGRLQRVLHRHFYPRPPRGGRPGIPGIHLHPKTDFYPRPPRGGRRCPASGSWRTCLYFYPRPPRGGRRGLYHEEEILYRFLSTPSARRATAMAIAWHKCHEISIHALREEGDGQQRHGRHDPDAISIHALREEGDRQSRWQRGWVRNFYPRPPRGGRLYLLTVPPTSIKISIHALREEGDVDPESLRQRTHIFLSTPSARRATHQSRLRWHREFAFLSTPSARRATCCRWSWGSG